jgi:hypothetical protein
MTRTEDFFLRAALLGLLSSLPIINPIIPPTNSIDPSMIEGTPIRYAAVRGIPDIMNELETSC